MVWVDSRDGTNNAFAAAVRLTGGAFGSSLRDPQSGYVQQLRPSVHANLEDDARRRRLGKMRDAVDTTLVGEAQGNDCILRGIQRMSKVTKHVALGLSKCGTRK